VLFLEKKLSAAFFGRFFSGIHLYFWEQKEGEGFLNFVLSFNFYMSSFHQRDI
jgi:hypothetical protein